MAKGGDESPSAFTHRHIRYGTLTRIVVSDEKRVTFLVGGNTVTLWRHEFNEQYEAL